MGAGAAVKRRRALARSAFAIGPHGAFTARVRARIRLSRAAAVDGGRAAPARGRDPARPRALAPARLVGPGRRPGGGARGGPRPPAP